MTKNRELSRDRWIEAFGRLGAEWEAAEPRESLELEVLAALIGRLEDDDSDVRFAAIRELFTLSSERVRSDVLLAVRYSVGDADPRVRKVAAAMLDYDGISHFSKRSRGMARSESWQWNDETPAPPTQPPLCAMEPARNPALQEARTATGQLAQGSFGRLAAALGNPDIAIRLAAVDAFEAMDRDQPDAGYCLLQAMQDPCQQVRQKAGLVLRHVLVGRSARLGN